MRSLLPALIVLAAAGCSEGGDPPPDDAATPVADDGAASAEDASPPAVESAGTREVVSGTVSGIALDMSPAVADMTSEDGRMMALEIATGEVDAVIGSWGGVGTALRLDCVPGEPFKTEDGATYEYYTDCRLP